MKTPRAICWALYFWLRGWQPIRIYEVSFAGARCSFRSLDEAKTELVYFDEVDVDKVGLRTFLTLRRTADAWEEFQGW